MRLVSALTNGNLSNDIKNKTNNITKEGNAIPTRGPEIRSSSFAMVEGVQLSTIVSILASRPSCPRLHSSTL